MSPTEAYKIICGHFNQTPTIMSASDYGDFYSFVLAPPDSDKTLINFVGGSAFCVYKKNGKVEKVLMEKLPNKIPKRVAVEE